MSLHPSYIGQIPRNGRVARVEWYRDEHDIERGLILWIKPSDHCMVPRGRIQKHICNMARTQGGLPKYNMAQKLVVEKKRKSR